MNQYYAKKERKSQRKVFFRRRSFAEDELRGQRQESEIEIQLRNMGLSGNVGNMGLSGNAGNVQYYGNAGNPGTSGNTGNMASPGISRTPVGKRRKSVFTGYNRNRRNADEIIELGDLEEGQACLPETSPNKQMHTSTV